jgi:hypothetical protein
VTEIEKAEEDGGQDAPEGGSSTPVILQFVLIPLAVVAVCVTVIYGVLWLVSSTVTTNELLDNIQNGSSRSRWDAANQLAIQLVNDEENELRGNPEISRILTETYANLSTSTNEDDRKALLYLARCIGMMKTDGVADFLLDHLVEASTHDEIIALLDGSVQRCSGTEHA